MRETDSRAQGRDVPDSMCAESFDELFERYERKIFNLIYRLIGDHEEATDLASETFVQALRSFNRFRGEARPYTWLYRIAINQCKNYFRRRDVRKRVHGPSLDERVAADGDGGVQREVADWRHAPQRNAERRELQREVERAIAALSPDARMVVVLRDVHGFSYQEIAEMVGVSLEVVKARLFRARAALREQLSEYLLPEA
ncbi:MAG: sigma-70 family RNA polymerase sigma factor [Armatimonadota bacterium]|nr:MAG: sigma-70 family RNA polymerase sigma factor [Armatimonadota bacterium]